MCFGVDFGDVGVVEGRYRGLAVVVVLVVSGIPPPPQFVKIFYVSGIKKCVSS